MNNRFSVNSTNYDYSLLSYYLIDICDYISIIKEVIIF